MYDWRYCGVDGDVVLFVELPDALKTLQVLPDQVGSALDARQFFGDFAIQGDDFEFLTIPNSSNDESLIIAGPGASVTKNSVIFVSP